MNVYMHQNHKAKKEKRKKGSLLVGRRDVNYKTNIVRIHIHIRMYVNKGKRNYSRKKKKIISSFISNQIRRLYSIHEINPSPHLQSSPH